MLNVDLEIKVETIPLTDLIDKNGNIKYDASSEMFGRTQHLQYEMLKNDIEKNGQLKPIWIWRNKISNGRHRFQALQELGIETIMVRRLPHKMQLPEREELALNEENTRRHDTPTQLACNAVKRYLELKESESTVTQADILKEFPASTANFANATWIHKKYPTVFKTLFNGGKVITDEPSRPTESLGAVVTYYKQVEKDLEELQNQQEMDEALARDKIQEELESIKPLDHNGKLKTYQAIESLVESILIASPNISKEDVAKYLFQASKNA